MSAPQPPYSYYPQQPQPPRRKSHTARNVILSIVGALVVIGVIGAALNGAKNPSSAGASPAATTPAPASPAAATTAPAAAARPRVLIRFDGSGIRNSAPFKVGSGPLTVRYSFDCSSFGQAGNFAADLLNGNQASLNSDDLSIANALAMSGHQVTTVYPQNPGADYHLSVNSECSWKIRVTG
jgi:hypothetical protein